jgi:polyhydroxyalkanoate synthesis regulator phasin
MLRAPSVASRCAWGIGGDVATHRDEPGAGPGDPGLARERDAAGWVADRLTSARADAGRIARELAEKGHLTRAQAAEIAAAVESAIDRGRDLITDALREPRRILDRLRAAGVAGDAHADSTDVATRDHAAARITALEERVAALEQALLHRAPRVRRGSEGD